MAVPGFQDIMLPLLVALKDGREQAISELIERLADQFRLSEQDRTELLPSGKQERFANRTHWAGTYLVKAGILERPTRGRLRITDRGRTILSRQPGQIDLAYLMQFPEIEEFRTKRSTANGDPPVEPEVNPEELLEQSYVTLRQQLAIDVLERLKTGSPRFFERTVVDLLVAMGYGGSLSSVA